MILLYTHETGKNNVSVGGIMVIWWPWCTAGERWGDFPACINVTGFYSCSLNLGVVQDRTWRLYVPSIVSTIPSRGWLQVYISYQNPQIENPITCNISFTPYILWVPMIHGLLYQIFHICLFPSLTTLTKIKADTIGSMWTIWNRPCLELRLENYSNPES